MAAPRHEDTHTHTLKHHANSAGRYFPPSGPVTLSAPSLLCWDIVARFSCASFFGSHLQDNEELLSVFVNLHLACFKVINTAAVMPKAFAFLAALDIKRHKRTITRYGARLAPPRPT